MSDAKQTAQTIAAFKAAMSAVPTTPNPDLSKVRAALTTVQTSVKTLSPAADSDVTADMATLTSAVNALNAAKPDFSDVNDAVSELTTALAA